MIASFGLFVFDTTTLLPDDINRHRDWRHPTAERFGAIDSSQFTGPGEEQIRFTGRLIPELAGSFSSIDTLAAMADAGEAHPLIRGDGKIFGNYVITALDEQMGAIIQGGLPRVVGFSIEMRRVPDTTDALGSDTLV